MKKSASIILAAGLAASLAACSIREKPLLTVVDAPIATAPDEASIAQTIEAKLTARGWDILDKAPGKITAKYSKGNPKEDEPGHSATIAVLYDADSYSIEYVDSENLDYDADKGDIHRIYNRWVHNLDTDLATAFGVTPTVQ